MASDFPDRLTANSHFAKGDMPLHVHLAKVLERDIEAHEHDFVEAVFVAKGQGHHEIYSADRSQSNTYPIITGDIFLITPDRKHAYRNNKDLEVYNIIFTPEIFGPETAELCSLPGLMDFLILEPLFREEDQFAQKLHLSPAQSRNIQEHLDQIIQESNDKKQGYKLCAKSVFIEMLVMLGRYFQSQMDDADQPLSDSRHRAIEQAIAFMESNFSEQLSLEDIATSVYLSPNYFSEVFKQSTGIAPWEYVTGLRLEQACALLKDTDRSITDIALSTGFSDSSYFSKVFKEKYSKTPSQYRKQ